MKEVKDLKIEYVPVEDLKPYEKNARAHHSDDVEAIAESIRQFGMRVPLVIDKKGNIIAGHTRYKACVMLGMETVPCVVADQLTLKQQRAFQLADNKTGELATWDTALLTSELDALASIFDVAALGFVNPPKKESKTDKPAGTDAGEDPSDEGMVTCPRCGKKFTKAEMQAHAGVNPFDEGETEVNLF